MLGLIEKGEPRKQGSLLPSSAYRVERNGIVWQPFSDLLHSTSSLLCQLLNA